MMLALLAPLTAGAAPAAAVQPAAAMAPAAAIAWGTADHPYAADSPWNARPLEPVLGNAVVPESKYVPAAGMGPYSTGVFVSRDSDPAVEVHGTDGKPGVMDPANGVERPIVIPHWPADVVPATGSDGHADIIDPSSGIVHSFWQLRKQQGGWTAVTYGWTRLDGRGWGDPARFYQGVRAAGVPASAGLIRKHEVNDSSPVFRHALALSLTFNALSRDPVYIFPATSADGNAATTNSGQIPEGALLMLPPSYDTSHIANPLLRKMAETLKLYGAYVVDRNDGTPFNIYAENGSGFELHPHMWNPTTATELQRIRASLRQVISAKGWIDGDGKPFIPQTRLSLIAMDGNWRGQAGTGAYRSASDMVEFAPSGQRQSLSKLGVLQPAQVAWAAPRAGDVCRFSVTASGGGKLRLLIRSKDYAQTLFDSGELGAGEQRQLPCPGGATRYELQAVNGLGKASSVRGDLHAVAPGTP